MNSAVLASPRDILREGVLPRTVDELRTFVGLSPRTAKQADTSIADLLGRISQITEGMFLAALEKRTAEEFHASSLAAFNDYAQLMRAKADLLSVLLRNDMARAECLIHQSLTEVEADLREHATARFGTALADQALFTVWTLRKTTSLVWTLFDQTVAPNAVLSADDREKLAGLSSDFAGYSAWAQFHLNCLNAAGRLRRPIYPEVTPAIMNGLRAMVNAHGYARQIVDLLRPEGEPLILDRGWDDEEEALLGESMADIRAEVDGD